MTRLMFTTIISLVMLGVSIYALVLFIMLAQRGIKALDIYINEKSNKNL
ncbi:MAG TPA: hypothetical protein VEG39_02300 [Clostridia bacterium]|nr:hypothetical protein [Clostridia bacterium]